MLRSEFDEHEIWLTISAIRERMGRVRAEHVAEEQPTLERISFYLSHVESFRDMATTSSGLFTTEMLNQVQATLALVLSNTDIRASNGPSYSSHLDSAAIQAESVLMVMGPWPRPYGRGGQVRQVETMFEDLLEEQRKSVKALKAEHDSLREEVEQLGSTAEGHSDALLTKVQELADKADVIAATIETQKERIDQVVTSGVSQIAELDRRNDEAFDKWKEERAKVFDTDFSPFRTRIEEKLASAETALEKLETDQSQYARLLSATAGGELSKHFHAEASEATRSGVQAYRVGIGLLLASAAPLILVLIPFFGGSENPSWSSLSARLAIGALGASAATVLIRLGARFFSNAQASKRMGLELQTFDPFLANVSETGMVDTARLELVDRAFFKSYVPNENTKEEDVIAVSTMSQILGAITKIVGR